MPSKELIEKVARAMAGADMEDYMEDFKSYDRRAQAAISTILAALQEPTFEMAAAFLKLSTFEHPKDVNAMDAWRAMLAASALGEQSE